MMKGKPNNSNDQNQNRLYGLHRQGKTENIEDAKKEFAAAFAASNNSTNAIEVPKDIPNSAQLLAWNECLTTEPDDAKREFLNGLFVSAPYWKFEQFI